MRDFRTMQIAGFQNHLLFYRVERDRSVLRVVHILHGAREMEGLLGDALCDE